MGYPIPLEPVVHPESGLSFPWSEWISREGWSQDGSFGADDQGANAVFNVMIQWEDLDTALQELLGFSYRQQEVRLNADGTTTLLPPVLRRNLPWQHPRWNNLWCTRIAKFRGVKVVGKDSRVIVPRVGLSTAGLSSTYKFAILYLNFSRPRYVIMSDEDATHGEWQRYTDRNWSMSTQILQREANLFKYDEGIPAGKTIPASLGIPLGKGELQRTWHQVPQACLFTPEPDGFPTNLIKNLSTVNDAQFFGSPAGTLLYMGPTVKPRPLQMPAALMFISDLTLQQQYDVTFRFLFFDPAPLGAGVTIRGHNLVPWFDGKWYPASSRIDGRRPLQTSTFSDLFKVI